MEALNKIWLSEKEAVAYTSLSRNTLLENRNNGRITYRTYGRKIIYKSTDLDKFIEKNTELILSSEEYISKHRKRLAY